jgi:hypothetical protein
MTVRGEGRYARIAGWYIERHRARAPIVIGDNIARALAAERWCLARSWFAIRKKVWELQGGEI